jgi:hypothetical protein
MGGMKARIGGGMAGGAMGSMATAKNSIRYDDSMWRMKAGRRRNRIVAWRGAARAHFSACTAARKHFLSRTLSPGTLHHHFSFCRA